MILIKTRKNLRSIKVNGCQVYDHQKMLVIKTGKCDASVEINLSSTLTLMLKKK